MPQNYIKKTRWSQKGRFLKTTKLHLQTFLNSENFDALKTIRIIRSWPWSRTCLHVPSGTLWSTSSDTRQVVKTRTETSTKMFTIFCLLPACRGTLSLLVVCQSVCPSVTLQFSGLFSAVFWDIDLKFSIWICHDIIQIKFEFRYAWHTFTGVIALC